MNAIKAPRYTIIGLGNGANTAWAVWDNHTARVVSRHDSYPQAQEAIYGQA